MLIVLNDVQRCVIFVEESGCGKNYIYHKNFVTADSMSLKSGWKTSCCVGIMEKPQKEID